MRDNSPSLASAPFNKLRLAGNHGYRFQGDLAFLNAELVDAPADDGRAPGAQLWALQLWACESPHQGGALRGIKVAQAELSKATLTRTGEDEPARLEAETFANLPAYGEYAMVLVLAASEGGEYDQVLDFSNYAERQQFVGPRLQGSSGYRFDHDGVLLQAEGVRNTRDEDNLSGSLALELWALSEPYQGGDLRGTLLASAALGCLWGGTEERYIERHARLNQAPVGEWRLSLVLTEWTHVGHVARDFCNFALPYVVQAQEAHAVAAAVEAPKEVAELASKSAVAAVSSPAAGKESPAAQPVVVAPEPVVVAPEPVVVAPEAAAAPTLESVTSTVGKEGALAELTAAASKAPPAEAAEQASKETSAPKLLAVASKEAVAIAAPASADASAAKATPETSKASSAEPAAVTSKDAAAPQAAVASKDAPTAPAAVTSKDASASKVTSIAGKDATAAKSAPASTHRPS